MYTQDLPEPNVVYADLDEVIKSVAASASTTPTTWMDITATAATNVAASVTNTAITNGLPAKVGVGYLGNQCYINHIIWSAMI